MTLIDSHYRLQYMVEGNIEIDEDQRNSLNKIVIAVYACGTSDNGIPFENYINETVVSIVDLYCKYGYSVFIPAPLPRNTKYFRVNALGIVKKRTDSKDFELLDQIHVKLNDICCNGSL